MLQRQGQIEVHPSFRFTIAIDDIQVAAFLECKLPNLQVETMDVKEGGQNEYTHKLPVRVNAGSVTLKHGITKNRELLTWYLEVLEGKIKKATRNVSVVMYDVSQKPMTKWTFEQAYPIKWNGPQLNTSGQALAIEEIEIIHHGFSVQAL